MKDLKLKRIPKDEVDIECAKRQHAPYILTCVCECGNKLGIDYSDDYLMYPNAGETSVENFYCDECGEEPKFKLKFDVVLSIVK